MVVHIYNGKNVTLKTNVMHVESFIVGRFFKLMKLSIRYNDGTCERLNCTGFEVDKQRR